MSHLPHTNESRRPTYLSMRSPACAHTDKSCPTYEWVMFHLGMRHVVPHTYPWHRPGFGKQWMSYVTHGNASCVHIGVSNVAHRIASCRPTHLSMTSSTSRRQRMRCVTQWEWVMSNMGMSHVTHELRQITHIPIHETVESLKDNKSLVSLMGMSELCGK